MRINFSTNISAKSTKSALSWVGFFQFFQVLFRVIVNLILAKLLLPEDFGIIAIVTVLSEVLMGIVNMGMGAAIIQKQGLDIREFNSAFFGNFIMAFFLALLMFFLAKPIANFYRETELITLIRILSFIFIVRGISTAQLSWYEKMMHFNITISISFVSLIISNIIKIVLAILGYGAMSIVIGELVYHSLITIVLTFYSGYIPKLSLFSREKFSTLFMFGNKLMIADFLGVLSQKFDVLIIGKLANSRDLGIYTFAFMIAVSIINAINYVIQKVFFPKFSKIQDNNNQLKEVYFSATKLLALATLPICIGTFFIADKFILSFYHGKWDDAIIIIKLLSLYAATNTLGGVLWGQVLKAKGLSKQVLYLTYIRVVVLLVLMIVVLHFSDIVTLAYSMIAYGLFFRFLFQYKVNKMLEFSMVDYFKSIYPALRNGIILFIILYFINLLIDNLFQNQMYMLFVLIFILFLVQIVIFIIWNKNEIKYLKNSIKNDN